LHLNVVAFVGVVLPFTPVRLRGAAHLVGARRHLERRDPARRAAVAALVFRTERFTGRKVAGLCSGSPG
jgi:hypothetical protein